MEERIRLDVKTEKVREQLQIQEKQTTTKRDDDEINSIKITTDRQTD